MKRLTLRLMNLRLRLWQCIDGIYFFVNVFDMGFQIEQSAKQFSTEIAFVIFQVIMNTSNVSPEGERPTKCFTTKFALLSRYVLF